ncbi:hypothetical protein [Pandoraea pulmonicola]|uniref:Uncharacterized protein n=1 Tax=Pandoraea pulmonicola TaxID=93221 RepID=A0AAJ5CYX3_PANPU|nr:hypothetical protein [Pandoraea pulmonicola]AJC22041.1 hypothetical protein RO07_18920 [Pandoraea pulmonicola]SUA88973.1 Uncharacterised protein [Pandoraea pulmonicola]
MQKGLALLTALLCCSLSAQAGEFIVTSFGDTPTNAIGLVRDLVTDEFTAQFPAEQYEIVLEYHCMKMSGGDATCSAIAGVSPRLSSKEGKGSLMPVSRYNSISSKSNGRAGVSAGEINTLRENVIRGSVRELMSVRPADLRASLERARR